MKTVKNSLIFHSDHYCKSGFSTDSLCVNLLKNERYLWMIKLLITINWLKTTNNQ